MPCSPCSIKRHTIAQATAEVITGAKKQGSEKGYAVKRTSQQDSQDERQCHIEGHQPRGEDEAVTEHLPEERILEKRVLIVLEPHEGRLAR